MACNKYCFVLNVLDSAAGNVACVFVCDFLCDALYKHVRVVAVPFCCALASCTVYVCFDEMISHHSYSLN